MSAVRTSPMESAGDGRGRPGVAGDRIIAAASHTSIPVVAHWSGALAAAERRAVARVARRLLAEEPALSSTAAFGPNVSAGLGPWPALVLEDHSGITAIQPAEDRRYGYRALLLAGQGDQVAIGTRRKADFERYCRETLGLGAVEVLSPRRARGWAPLAKRCIEDRALIRRLAARARAAGGYNVVTYMGTGGAWSLAGAIARRAGVAVRVAAPPPRLTRRVNDKLWFAARVREVLGERAAPAGSPVYSLATAIGRLRELSRRHASVAIKVPDSSGAEGNVVMEASELANRSALSVRERLVDRLREGGWEGGFPLMVTAWEHPVIASPSVQLWLPERAAGGPMVEGIFDQEVAGPAGRFAGAAPTALAPAVQDRLARAAVCLATVFQDLGYFGRCSFDAIVLGDRRGPPPIHWVECNGRWGGVSIPMTLANRLVGDWRRRPFVLMTCEERSGTVRPLAELLRTLGDDVYVPGAATGGAVVIMPGAAEARPLVTLMVLDETVAAARTRARAILAKLLPPDRAA